MQFTPNVICHSTYVASSQNTAIITSGMCYYISFPQAKKMPKLITWHKTRGYLLRHYASNKMNDIQFCTDAS